MTVGAIILAAGSARRMGADKLLADLGGRPMIRHIVDAIETAGLPMPLVAVPQAAGALVAALGGYARPIAIADPAEGIGRSLATAVRYVPGDWRAAIICLGDMPFVGPDVIAALAACVDEDRIVTPLFAGRRGNPVAWGRAYFADLAQLDGDRGGKRLLDGYADRVVTLEWSDPAILIDVDTPEALTAARERFEAGP